MPMIGQTNWGGGMNCYDPGDTQYRDGRNLVIRSGKPETRPGMRRYWRSNASGLPSFWFNQDYSRLNDDTHTGFWFPFDFVRQPWGGMQGCGKIRFPGETADSIIVVTEGTVYRAAAGYMVEIPCTETIGSDESIAVIQAHDIVFLLRGETLPPLGWDGGAAGFTLVPDPDPEVADAMPFCSAAVYHPGGRLWVWNERDEVYASDIIEFNHWDLVGQHFSVKPGDGDEIMALHPFHEDTLLVFKRRSVTALSGINAIVDVENETLGDVVTQMVVDSDAGLVARRAVVTVGEDIWYLGYGGIYSMARNQQNKLQRQAVALSAPIQTWVARINWRAVERAAATIHDNYVVFAVPVDGSERNNCWLVYDLLAPGADGGAWVGVWTAAGRLFDVLEWFKLDERQMFLDGQGIIRQAFLDVATDTDEPIEDTPEYDAGAQILKGDLARVNGVLYQAIVAGPAVAPPDPTAWTEVDDPQHCYAIQFGLTTRVMTLDEAGSSMLLGRGELLFRHQRPRMDVDIFAEFLQDAEALFEAVEYDETEHDIADTADWQPATDDGGLHNTHRQDLALVIPSGGLLVGSRGMTAGQWRTHGLRFIRRLGRDRGVGFDIRNERGRVRLEALAIAAEPRRFAVKE